MKRNNVLAIIMVFAVAFSVLAVPLMGVVSAQDGTDSTEDYSTAPDDLATIHNNMDGDGTESNPYVVTDSYELEAVNEDLTGYYVLGNDIDASGTATWNPIGDVTGENIGHGGETSFSTKYVPNDGTVTVYVAGTEADTANYSVDYSTGEITFDAAPSSGSDAVTADYSTDVNSGFNPIGLDSSNDFTGNFDGQGYKIENLYINRPGTSGVGLFSSGADSASFTNTELTNIDYTGGATTGGLIGSSNGGDITNISVTGSLDGTFYVGGVIGQNGGITVDESYTNVDISSDDSVGGIVGWNDVGSTLKDSYSHGSITADNTAGGIVGQSDDSEVLTSFSSVEITANTDAGGVVGVNNGTSTVTDSYWDTDSTGLSSDGSSGAVGLTTSEMKGSSAETNLTGFDFESTWSTVESSDADAKSDSYPILTSMDRQSQLSIFNIYEIPIYDVNIETVDTDGNSVESTVTLYGVTKTGSTTSFSIGEGEYTATVEADGYEMVEQTVTADSNKTVEISLTEESTDSTDSTDETDDTDDSDSDDEDVATSPGAGGGSSVGDLIGGIVVIVLVILFLLGFSGSNEDDVGKP